MAFAPDLTMILQNKQRISFATQLRLVWSLSIPPILAQIASVIMQYIDAAMVGSLGAEQAAAIGVVASTTWLFYGISGAASAGFSVQVAQAVGSGNTAKAKQIVRESIIAVLLLSVILGLLAVCISPYLPIWLHSDSAIHSDAQAYFLIFGIAVPFMMLTSLGLNLLECSGNMRIPSILSVLLCVFDVFFNFLFIFPVRFVTIAGRSVMMPGFGWGVAGAAWGTAVSEVVVCVITFFFVLYRSEVLRLHVGGSWKLSQECIRTASKISIPIFFEQVAVSSAQVVSTRIVAPLGTVPLAANSLGVTAESLCYMPGYGIATAATTLVGQSIGAQRADLAKRFAWLTTIVGMAVMGITGVLMYIGAPLIFSFMTPDANVQQLGITVLRIEVFAEPLFAACIVASGALRGAGNTLIPGIINLITKWCVRITLAYVLSKTYGLVGVWIAMCIELCVRGLLCLLLVYKQNWNVQILKENKNEQHGTL